MRMRMLLARCSLPRSRSLFVPAYRVGADELVRVDELRELRPNSRPRSASSSSIEGRDGRRLPEGAEPDPARDERAHLGHHLVRRAVRPAVEVRLPGLKKGMDDRTERIRADLDAAERRRPRPSRCSTSTGASWPTPQTRRPGSSRRPARRPTRSRRDQERGCRPSWPSMRSGRRPTSRRPRPRPSPTSGARWPRWPSAPPRSSCSSNLDRATQVQLVENYIDQVASQAN